MPTLLLNRQCEIAPDPPDSVAVVCEARPGLSTGWCAAIERDPDRPLSTWRRSYLAEAHRDPTMARTLRAYRPLPSGLFEAHSLFRSRWACAYIFTVDGPTVAVLGRSGDEDLVIAELNGVTIEELNRARKLVAKLARPDPEGLPALVGTSRQVAWAESLRADLLARVRRSGDPAMVEAVRSIADATWFIANRGKSLASLRLPRSPAPA